MSEKPTIIIFNPDQWRGDVLGHLGNPAAVTPNLDQLIETDGVSFSQAFCQNPVCTPSRCSFMSGLYPHVRGHRTIFHMMQPDEPVLLRTLKQEGYYVWWGGKNDLIPADANFDEYCDERFVPDRSKFNPDENWRGEQGSSTYYSFFAGEVSQADGLRGFADSDWQCIEAAIERINHPPEDKPLCIYLPITYPHPPYVVEEPWFSMIDRTKLPERVQPPEDFRGKPRMLKGLAEMQKLDSWTESEWAELRATYYGMCARVDHQFGMVLDALIENDLYEDAAVFFFSDHGDYTGDFNVAEKNQNTFEDSLSRVPLVIKPPKDVPVVPGIRDQLVELIDISATIEELLEITPRHTHFGKSLLQLLQQENTDHRDAVFCQGGRLHGETHCMELEAVEHQRPTGLYYPRLYLQRQEGPEHTKAIMCRTKDYKYVKRLYEQDELYDLKKDPFETNNRIDDPNLANQLFQLKERLLEFYVETSDIASHTPDKRF